MSKPCELCHGAKVYEHSDLGLIACQECDPDAMMLRRIERLAFALLLAVALLLVLR